MQHVTRPPTDLQALVQRLRVLSEPKRLLILQLIMDGVQCNCELCEALDMPANLISHHLRILRESGLVDSEHDPFDARWIYYSVNLSALAELNRAFGAFFDPARIKSRRHTCGPQSAQVPPELLEAERPRQTRPSVSENPEGG